MPTGLRNVVCDECHGGRLVLLATSELQLEHQLGCPYKYREDTFLIDLTLRLGGLYAKFVIYPDTKLNPIIYDMLCNNQFTYWGNDTFGKKRQSNAQKRAQKVNENFQLVRQALIDCGRWKYYLEDLRLKRELSVFI